ncbi:tumor necrosis factor receptor superfamily member 4 [Spea bombifrons]|uniref:tumor necrosis factor receptor superfamily member 4 n=1 Tax=Spea bombifrons TaxID=233779 RepID=UPI00234A9BD9|nr:tumor necrosis factor receptor superfamily member 4 [Spea bombifrons]
MTLAAPHTGFTLRITVCHTWNQILRNANYRTSTSVFPSSPPSSNIVANSYKRRSSQADESLKATGSIEEKPCDKSSGVVCRCPKGSSKKNERETACRCARGRQLAAKECVPCPQGHFSSQENSVCQPWTNCSAGGAEIQTPGTDVSDAICTKPTSHQWTSAAQLSNHRTTGTASSSSKRNSSHASVLNKEDHTTLTKNNDVSIKDGNVPGPFMNWGTLWLILVGLLLLFVSGGITIMMAIRLKPKKGNRRLYVRRCRLPVQEESSSSDSSLAKQCSV